MNIFDRINEWLDRTEVSWVNVLTKVLPIIVPIIPAIQTKTHVVSVLGYDEWTGWVAAVIVEFFGYAAMYKMIAFAEHNRKYTDPKNKAPLTFAILIYIAYLAIIIGFNVIPEIEKERPAYIVWMNALFSFLSVPAGALTAISAVHTERKEAMKRGKKNGTEQPDRTENTPVLRTQQRTPSVLRTQPQNVLRTDREQEAERQIGFPVRTDMRENVTKFVMSVRKTENRTPGVREVARAVGCAPSYAHTVIKNMKDNENV